MGGYEFIGFQALSDMTANGLLILWVSDHIALLGAIVYLGRFISKMTRTTVDDEFWTGLDEFLKKRKMEKKENG